MIVERYLKMETGTISNEKYSIYKTSLMNTIIIIMMIWIVPLSNPMNEADTLKGILENQMIYAESYRSWRTNFDYIRKKTNTGNKNTINLKTRKEER